MDKSMQPTSAPQVFLFGYKKAPRPASRTFFNANEGMGLKNGVPYLQMGLPTLAMHVSRRPEDK